MNIFFAPVTMMMSNTALIIIAIIVLIGLAGFAMSRRSGTAISVPIHMSPDEIAAAGIKPGDILACPNGGVAMFTGGVRVAVKRSALPANAQVRYISCDMFDRIPA